MATIQHENVIYLHKMTTYENDLYSMYITFIKLCKTVHLWQNITYIRNPINIIQTVSLVVFSSNTINLIPKCLVFHLLCHRDDIHIG